jgi:hypothetical protein
LLFSVYSFSQQNGYDPQPRPKNCQTENICPRNTLFHETTFRFGNLGFNRNSINWDHVLVCREGFLISLRLGIDYYSFSKIRSAGIPIDLNLMIGGGALMFETGLGLNYLFIYQNYDEVNQKHFDDNLSYLAATGRLGLRYEKLQSIFFRVGYTPQYSLMNNDQLTITNKKNVAIIHDHKIYSMISAGIGYTF